MMLPSFLTLAPRLPGLVGGLLVLLGTCTPHLSAEPRSTSTDDQVRLRRLLQDLRLNKDRPAAIVELDKLGPDGLPTLLGVLSGSLHLDGDEQGPLIDASTEGLLFDAVRGWPAKRSVDAVLNWIGPDAGSGERLLVLRLLGQIGGRETLRPFLDVLAAIRPEVQGHPNVRSQVEVALGAMLRRDPRGHQVLASSLRELDIRSLGYVARATARASAPGGLGLLEQLMGRSPVLDQEVLLAVGDWTYPHRECTGREAAQLAAGYLTSSEESLRLQAAGSLGKLRDTDSVPALIATLEDPDARVRKSAHWALQRIVGGVLPAEQGAWIDWHTRELDWFESSADELAALASDDTGKAVAALRNLAAHPLYRSEFVREIAMALRHTDTAVAQAACGTLAILRPPCAALPLIEALRDARPLVRASAAATLEGLTGAGLSGDLDAWREWLAR